MKFSFFQSLSVHIQRNLQEIWYYCDESCVSTLRGRCRLYSEKVIYYNKSLLFSLVCQEKPWYFSPSTYNSLYEIYYSTLFLPDFSKSLHFHFHGNLLIRIQVDSWNLFSIIPWLFYLFPITLFHVKHLSQIAWVSYVMNS